jgi:protein-disulfide isomerase
MKRVLPFLIILAVAIAGAAGGRAVYKAKRFELAHLPRPPVAPGMTEALGAQPPHLRGPRQGAEVVLEEFGDFQCPPCGLISPVLDVIEREYASKLVVIYRQFPLPMHEHALKAAAVAEAAAAQDRFWEMHKMLYDKQNEWATAQDVDSIFESYAKELGLALDRYRADLNAPATAARIEADQERGKSLGVTSTPTDFLNDERIPFLELTENGLRRAIDAALAGKKPIFGETE